MTDNCSTNNDVESDKLLNEEEKNNKLGCMWKSIFFALFFLLGLINNLGYVLILTGSSQLSSKFGLDDFNSLYLFSLIICSSLAKFINSTLLIKISYKIRLFFITLYFLTGYISMYVILNSIAVGGFSKTQAFFLSLIPSFIMGTGSAFGEATILGYLRNFPKDYVAGWSSGTGLAGVIGALVTLIFHMFGQEPKTMFLTISPVCALYFLSFILIERFYIKYLSDIKDKLIITDLVEKLETPVAEAEGNIVNNASRNKNLNWTNGKRAFTKGYRFIINLAAVYFLEYTILSGFAERVAKKGLINNVDKDYIFEYFSLCYQVGVFFSRSSLVVVKHIKFIEIFTILQIVSFVAWFVNVYSGFISIPAIAFINMVIVGLMGGAAYVACFYFILNSHKIEDDMKELCVNIASMFNDFGIFMSSLVILILNLTIMKIDA